jgi:hypothetical protein
MVHVGSGLETRFEGAEPSLAPRDEFDAARQQCSAGGGYDHPDVDDRWDQWATGWGWPERSKVLMVFIF